jgi:RNA polymerase sigma factor (sigma-70 family)
VRIARRILRDEADAEDSVQDSLINAFVNLRSFDGRSTFLTWATRITINCCFMRLRGRRRYYEKRLDSEIAEKVYTEVGCTALNPEQIVARDVQRLILLGTAPRGGEGLTFTELSPEEQADPVALLLAAFFSPSEASQAAGRGYMKRLNSRKKDRDLPVSRSSAVAQLATIREWGNIPATGRYATLKNITPPTLIVHCNKDVVVAPINALILAEHLPNAQLIVYSDSSHGAQYQHAKTFLQHVNLFLSDGNSQLPAGDSISVGSSVATTK